MVNAQNLSPLGAALLEYLSRKRSHDAVEVSKIEETFQTSERSEVIRALRELSEGGFGRLTIGRQGYETRFEMNAEGRKAGLSFRKDGSNGAPAEPIGRPSATMDEADHVFILRKNPLVRVTLPSDLTAQEADRLANWARTLPLD